MVPLQKDVLLTPLSPSDRNWSFNLFCIHLPLEANIFSFVTFYNLHDGVDSRWCTWRLKDSAEPNPGFSVMLFSCVLCLTEPEFLQLNHCQQNKWQLNQESNGVWCESYWFDIYIYFFRIYQIDNVCLSFLPVCFHFVLFFPIFPTCTIFTRVIFNVPFFTYVLLLLKFHTNTSLPHKILVHQ